MIFDTATITDDGFTLLLSAAAGEKIIWGTCKCAVDENGTFPVAKGYAVSSYKSASTDVAYITCSMDNTQSGCVPGNANYFLLYAKKDGDLSEVLAVRAHVGEHTPTQFPQYNPQDPEGTSLRGIVDFNIQLVQGVISEIDMTVSAYALASDLQKLSERVVTTHTVDSTTAGDNQTIYGDKLFMGDVVVGSDDQTECLLYLSKNQFIGRAETESGLGSITFYDSEDEEYGYYRTEIHNWNEPVSGTPMHQSIEMSYDGIRIDSGATLNIEGKSVNITSTNPVKMTNLSLKKIALYDDNDGVFAVADKNRFKVTVPTSLKSTQVDGGLTISSGDVTAPSSIINCYKISFSESSNSVIRGIDTNGVCVCSLNTPAAAATLFKVTADDRSEDAFCVKYDASGNIITCVDRLYSGDMQYIYLNSSIYPEEEDINLGSFSEPFKEVCAETIKTDKIWPIGTNVYIGTDEANCTIRPYSSSRKLDAYFSNVTVSEEISCHDISCEGSVSSEYGVFNQLSLDGDDFDYANVSPSYETGNTAGVNVGCVVHVYASYSDFGLSANSTIKYGQTIQITTNTVYLASYRTTGTTTVSTQKLPIGTYKAIAESSFTENNRCLVVLLRVS